MFLAAEARLFKADIDFNLHVASLDHTLVLFCRFRRSLLASIFCVIHFKELLELLDDLLKASLILLSPTAAPMEGREGKSKRIEAEALPSLISILLLIARHASGIVDALFVCIAKSFVCFIDLSEFLGRVLRLIDVWMVLLCFQQECLLDFLVAGCGCDAEHV